MFVSGFLLKSPRQKLGNREKLGKREEGIRKREEVKILSRFG